MIIQGGIFSFIAVTCFSILFKMPRKEIFFCGLTGSTGWIVYLLASKHFSMLTSTLISVIVIMSIARILSFRRKMPLTVYAVAGITPIVPGAGIYNTMYMIVTNNAFEASAKGIETIKTAGVIAIGMIIILSLPGQIFKFLSGTK